MLKREEDKELSPVERRVAIWTTIVKRHGVTGILIAVAPFVYPHIEKWWNNKQRDAILVPIQAEMKVLKNEVLYNRVLASKNHMLTLITADDFNVLVRHRVRSQSLDKIKEIGSVWEQSNRSTESGRKALWTKIKNILYRHTSIYVNEMRRYSHPVVGNIGSYLNTTFPMYRDTDREYRPDYSFLDVVYKISMDENTKDVDVFKDNLKEYMIAIQSEYFTDISRELKRLENEVKGF